MDRLTYERAVERAQVEGLKLLSHYETYQDLTRKAEVWEVYSPASRRVYSVRIDTGARALTCQCAAWEQGAYCKHRAFVRATVLLNRVTSKG